MDNLIRQSAVGLAPYRDDPSSVKAYNDTAKPKLYLSFGTPVVMTRVTLFSKEMEKAKAGFAVGYDPKEWAFTASTPIKQSTLSGMRIKK